MKQSRQRGPQFFSRTSQGLQPPTQQMSHSAGKFAFGLLKSGGAWYEEGRFSPDRFAHPVHKSSLQVARGLSDGPQEAFIFSHLLGNVCGDVPEDTTGEAWQQCSKFVKRLCRAQLQLEEEAENRRDYSPDLTTLF